MDTDAWIESWEKGDIAFHMSECNKYLVKHIDKLLGGKKKCKILFPLCGKAVDMKWLYSEGHTIIGVEGASQAVEEFFKESNLQFEKESVEKIDGTLYKSLDGRLRLYVCDFFNFSADLEKNIDSVWDRGSLGAINLEDRSKYAKVILPLLGEDFTYLVEGFDYDTSEYTGPPHCVKMEELVELFGDSMDIELLECDDVLSEVPWADKVTRFEIRIHSMTRKNQAKK